MHMHPTVEHLYNQATHCAAVRQHYHTLLDMCTSPQVARQTNADLLSLPAGYQSTDTEALLAAISSELQSDQEPTRLEALHWVNALLARSREEILSQQQVLLPALFDALSAASDRVVLEALNVQAGELAPADARNDNTLLPGTERHVR